MKEGENIGIMKSLKDLKVNEEIRFDVSRLDAITWWLQENRAY
ncbi:hypothetical protein IEE_02873 [Bacillus cereus BAG5X1-1]|uniref:Uncharacterized protein n=1 Tax=Bacillus cereus BAG5X1-1 TaxID=1053189 RepID=J7XK01_BACCE|nr:hypothetical protein IEE_02873 [Bacillus cereus BAG5X1-1]